MGEFVETMRNQDFFTDKIKYNYICSIEKLSKIIASTALFFESFIASVNYYYEEYFAEMNEVSEDMNGILENAIRKG